MGTPAVVAVIDSGLDPYQPDFAAPEVPPPPALLPDYPVEALPLALHLGQGPAQGFAVDQDAFRGARPGQLYWVPGTSIVGWIQFHPDASTKVPLYDNVGHGTAVAATVLREGRAGTLLVMVQTGIFDKNGLSGTLAGVRDALQWVARQPWIDLVSLSLGDNVASHLDSEAGLEVARATRDVVASGKLVVAAAGNLVVPQVDSRIEGPPWVVAVGGVDPKAAGANAESAKFPDLAANWSIEVPAPGSSTPQHHGGTSFAAPVVAGLIARALVELRAEAPSQGGTDRAGAFVPQGPGALADGHLSPEELRAALNATAAPIEAGSWSPSPWLTDPTRDPPSLPIAPPGAAEIGWGYVTGGAAEALVAHLRGKPAPERLEVATAMQAAYLARAALWSWT